MNAALELASLLNEGPDHQCTYELIPLPAAASLEEALAQHFEVIFVAQKGSVANLVANWGLKVAKLGRSSPEALNPILTHWIFRTKFSPVLGGDREWVQLNVISTLCSHIQQVVGEAEVAEVYTTPPIWYEALWQDIAFSSSRGRWLLHFGMTD